MLLVRRGGHRQKAVLAIRRECAVGVDARGGELHPRAHRGGQFVLRVGDVERLHLEVLEKDAGADLTDQLQRCCGHRMARYAVRSRFLWRCLALQRGRRVVRVDLDVGPDVRVDPPPETVPSPQMGAVS